MKIDSANAIKIQAQTRLSRYAPRPPTKVFCIELLLLGIRNSEELFNCVPGPVVIPRSRSAIIQSELRDAAAT